MQLPTASPEIDDLTFTAARIFAPVSRDLAAVEEELERLSQSDVQVVSHIGEYLRASGGKRVRPALLPPAYAGLRADGEVAGGRGPAVGRAEGGGCGGLRVDGRDVRRAVAERHRDRAATR